MNPINENTGEIDFSGYNPPPPRDPDGNFERKIYDQGKYRVKLIQAEIKTEKNNGYNKFYGLHFKIMDGPCSAQVIFAMWYFQHETHDWKREATENLMFFLVSALGKGNEKTSFKELVEVNQLLEIYLTKKKSGEKWYNNITSVSAYTPPNLPAQKTTSSTLNQNVPPQPRPDEDFIDDDIPF